MVGTSGIIDLQRLGPRHGEGLVRGEDAPVLQRLPQAFERVATVEETAVMLRTNGSSTTTIAAEAAMKSHRVTIAARFLLALSGFANRRARRPESPSCA